MLSATNWKSNYSSNPDKSSIFRLLPRQGHAILCSAIEVNKGASYLKLVHTFYLYFDIGWVFKELLKIYVQILMRPSQLSWELTDKKVLVSFPPFFLLANYLKIGQWMVNNLKTPVNFCQKKLGYSNIVAKTMKFHSQNAPSNLTITQKFIPSD